jgi:hypothetical protein
MHCGLHLLIGVMEPRRRGQVKKRASCFLVGSSLDSRPCLALLCTLGLAGLRVDTGQAAPVKGLTPQLGTVPCGPGLSSPCEHLCSGFVIPQFPGQTFSPCPQLNLIFKTVFGIIFLNRDLNNSLHPP